MTEEKVLYKKPIINIMIIDPVCGMEVDEKSQYKTMYKGKVYYFCSSYCLKEFQKNPEEYLRGGPKGMPNGH